MNVVRIGLVGAALASCIWGCSKKPDVKTSVSDLEKAFPTAAATPVAQTPPSPQPAAPTPTARPSADDFVTQAVAAARASDYAGSVIALQVVQQSPGVTAEQVMAVQRAKQALMADLQRRAANGDQAALAQLKAIEKTRSQ